MLILLPILICTYIHVAHASAFLIMEQNAGSSGDVHAGAEATSQDASALAWNPAAILGNRFPQTVLSMHQIVSESSFSGHATQFAFDEAGEVYPFSSPIYQGSGRIRKHNQHTIPSWYASIPLEKNEMALGFGIWPEFGLSTNWGEKNWTRYSATRSAISGINAMAAMASRWNRDWTIGIAAGFQRVEVQMDAILGVGADSDFDMLSRNRLVGTEPVWQAGALWEMDPQTRIGFSFQSGAQYHLSGKSELSKSGPSAIIDANGEPIDQSTSTGSARLHTPSVWGVGLVTRLNDTHQFAASARYTTWSRIRSLELQNVASVRQYDTDNRYRADWSVTTIRTSPNWKDAVFLSAGWRLRVSPQYTFKTGIGVDFSPARLASRDLRMPDSDRLLWGMGVMYSPYTALDCHISWKKVWLRAAPIGAGGALSVPPTVDDNGDMLTPGSFSSAEGVHKGSANVWGIQFTVKML